MYIPIWLVIAVGLWFLMDVKVNNDGCTIGALVGFLILVPFIFISALFSKRSTQ